MSAYSPIRSPVRLWSPTSTPDRSSEPSSKEISLEPKKEDELSGWYHEVLKVADIADSTTIPGHLIMKPWGVAIWRQIQSVLDKTFQQQKIYENHIFPLSIPESSTIFKELLKEKISSTNRLPVGINRWLDQIPWGETSTMPFISEDKIPWQEGYALFATEVEALSSFELTVQIYRSFFVNFCALPILLKDKDEDGYKTTFIETVMPDGSTQNIASCSYLGTDFAESSEIYFRTRSDRLLPPYALRWKLNFGAIGGLMMIHSDNKGMCVPPRISPHQVVIITTRTPSIQRDLYLKQIESILQKQVFFSELISIKIDDRQQLNHEEKRLEWYQKGIPIIILATPFDVNTKKVDLYRRDREYQSKERITLCKLVEKVTDVLYELQETYYGRAI